MLKRKLTSEIFRNVIGNRVKRKGASRFCKRGIMDYTGQQSLGNINLVGNSVAYNLIDKQGRSRRFYRQVQIEEAEGWEQQQKGYTITLDHRPVLTKDSTPLFIDTFDLACVISHEWEMQGEFLRLEALPLTKLQMKHNDLSLDQSNRFLLRRGRLDLAFRAFESDLLKCADNLEHRGFYDENWKPIMTWFNQRFGTNIQIKYADIAEESHQDEQKAMDDWDDFQGLVSNLNSANPDNRLNIFGSKMQGLLKDMTPDDPGTFKSWYRERTDIELLVMDEMLMLIPSPILVSALLCDGCTLEQATSAADCTELNTKILSTHHDNLKYVDTCLALATGKTFLLMHGIKTT